MKKFFRFVAFATAIMMLTGCGISSFPTKSYNVSETQVVLNQKNFRVLGSVSGESTLTRVFGIGGVSQRAVRENAIADMFNNANLSNAQTIININVKKHVSAYYIFYIRTTYTATGQIIEFTE